MTIGVIALEFPPDIGGMQQYAASLTEALSKLDDVVLFTGRDKGEPGASYRQVPILSGRLENDVPELKSQRVDVWYALNCGYAAAAPALNEPFFVNCNGNDFLAPWVGYGNPWQESAARVPYFWRYAPALGQLSRERRLRRGLRSARRIFAISHATAKAFDQMYPGLQNVTQVVPCGVSEDFFRLPLPEVSTNTLRLLTVGRLNSPRKNVESVLHAIAQLGNELPIHYTVVGGGERLGELKHMAVQLGLGQKVTFRGEVSKADLLSSYRSSDLFVMASKATRNDFEGFGIVYLEASAAGVPVVCSREGGAVDAVQEGRNGLILDESSPEAIADGLRRFARDRASYTPSNVRAFAEGFRWDVIAKELWSQIRAHA
jgi:glycosyltransferase involved in cell wall biosynthesis